MRSYMTTFLIYQQLVYLRRSFVTDFAWLRCSFPSMLLRLRVALLLPSCCSPTALLLPSFRLQIAAFPALTQQASSLDPQTWRGFPLPLDLYQVSPIVVPGRPLPHDSPSCQAAPPQSSFVPHQVETRPSLWYRVNTTNNSLPLPRLISSYSSYQSTISKTRVATPTYSHSPKKTSAIMGWFGDG